jgi:hypothetical protein
VTGEPRARDVADEPESGCHLTAVSVSGPPTLVEHVEVADQLIQAGRPARGRDHRVHGKGGSVDEDGTRAVQRVDSRDHLHPTLPDRVDHLGVDDRRTAAGAPQPAHRTVVGEW